jgi:hypothetical protein
MAKLTEQPFPDEDEWRRALGGFIWRMGQLEYLTYEWCVRLGGVKLRDAAITKTGFRGRYDLVVDAVASNEWPSEKKTKALRLWRAAKCFSVFRNKIAHAPVLEVRGVSVMLDARCLVGEGKRPLMVFRPEFIARLSDHIQALAQKLDRILDAA